MTGPIHRASGVALTVLSCTALLTIAIGVLQRQPPQPDEGTLAHIFQLSVGLAGLTLLVFLATWDRDQSPRSVRTLIVSGIVLVLAFGALYYFEHLR
jgi:hypothetical protein